MAVCPTAFACSTSCTQYSDGIDSRRFISEAVEAPIDSARPTAAGPPKALKMSAIVSIPTVYTNRVHLVNMIAVHTMCEDLGMNEMGDRLKMARENAGFASARSAAIRNGWKESTYAAHENGQNKFSVEEAERYADAFSVDDAWLLTGRGRETAAKVIKVVGRIGAGGSIDTSGEQIGLDDPLFEIKVSGLLIEDPIAYEVVGESMIPRYDAGDIVIVSAKGVGVDRMVGEEAAVMSREGSRYLKIVEPGSRPGLYDLVSHNAKTIRDEELVWASSVAQVIRASHVKRKAAARYGK